MFYFRAKLSDSQRRIQSDAQATRNRIKIENESTEDKNIRLYEQMVRQQKLRKSEKKEEHSQRKSKQKL